MRLRDAAVGLAVAGFLFVLLLVVQPSTGKNPLGANDYLEYWSAFDVAAAGGNAYDPVAVKQVQDSVGLSGFERKPILFWNPPWVLVVLSPVVALPFDAGNAAWLVANIGLGLFAAWASWRLFADGEGPIPPVALAGSLLFLPFLETLTLGQLGALMAAVVIGGLLALRRGNLVVAGMLMALWSMKPQTLILLVLVLAIHLLATRCWRVIGSVVVTVGVLFALSALAFPTTTGAWSPLQGPTEWRTASLAGWLRAMLEGAGEPPVWPLYVVPLVGLLLVTPWALRHRMEIRWDAIPFVACLSFLFAPHTWIFDAVFLIPVQTLLLGRAWNGDRRARAGVGALVAAQLAAVWFRSLEWTRHQHLLWVPVVIGLIWVAFGTGIRSRAIDEVPARPDITAG